MKRTWTEAEDQIVLTRPTEEAAQLIGVPAACVRQRHRRLRPATRRKLLTTEAAMERVRVRPYDSAAQEERVRLIAGPYAPPEIPIGGMLCCELRGHLVVDGYSDALIPWPVAAGHHKQLIVCGDLVRALRTESRLAICFHFNISPQQASFYRARLGIERLTPGSTRLFWRSVDLARSDEARAKMSRQREGRKDLMKPEDRERLRGIQRRPKPEEWKQRMSERQQRLAAPGRAAWTEEELRLIGTRPDREVARLLNRSLSAVKAKKFQLLKPSGERQPSEPS